MELVDINAVFVGPKVKADGDQLDDDLLDEIKGGRDEEGNEDLVHCDLPRFSSSATFKMVMDHDGQKRDEDSQIPEEDGGWQFQLLAHISPLFAIVREETQDQTDGPRHRFGNNPTSPESEPHHL